MKGFTFIELLVAVGLSLLLVGAIIVNYNSYNDDQKLKQAALTFKNNLRFAQTQAFSGKKPSSGCTQLIGYTVSFTSSAYTIQAKCSEGMVGETWATPLPTGIIFSPLPSSFTFGVLSQGLLGSDAVTVTLAGSSKSYGIQVSPGGDINDLGFQ